MTNWKDKDMVRYKSSLSQSKVGLEKIQTVLIKLSQKNVCVYCLISGE